jgi:hypothetical protein
MSGYFHSCVLVALAVFFTGCGEKPSDPVTTVEKEGIKPAEVQTNTKISLDSTALDTTIALSDHKRIQGSWTFVTLTTEHKDHVVFSGDKFSWHVRERAQPVHQSAGAWQDWVVRDRWPVRDGGMTARNANCPRIDDLHAAATYRRNP